MIVLSNFIACPPHHPSGWVRLSGPEMRRRQAEVQAGDEAHEDPHHDARFGAEHEGVGEAEDLVGYTARRPVLGPFLVRFRPWPAARDEPRSVCYVERPGIDAPGGADEGRPQGHVGDEAGTIQTAYCIIESNPQVLTLALAQSHPEW